MKRKMEFSDGASAIFAARRSREEARSSGAGAALLTPALGFGDAVADERHQQRGRAARQEHGAPSVARADGRNSQRRRGRSRNNSRCAYSRRRVRGGLRATLRRQTMPPRVHSPPMPMPASKRKMRQLPNTLRQRAAESEDRITEHGEHQRAHAAEAIADGTPQERESPADQEEAKSRPP